MERYVKLFALFCVFGGVLTIPEEKFFTSNQVEILNENNIKQFLSENPAVFVMFYKRYCSHSFDAAPKFSEAAEIVQKQNLNYKMAAIDGVGRNELMQRFKIRGYPTFILFKNGSKTFYNEGADSATYFVNWLKQMK